MQVILIFSHDPELRQEMVTSTIPEIYKCLYCNVISSLTHKELHCTIVCLGLEPNGPKLQPRAHKSKEDQNKY
jgi:hypothetical protein